MWSRRPACVQSAAQILMDAITDLRSESLLVEHGCGDRVSAKHDQTTGTEAGVTQRGGMRPSTGREECATGFWKCSAQYSCIIGARRHSV
jgi:hypothetical protein